MLNPHPATRFDSNGCMCGKNCTDEGLGDNTDKYNMYMPNPVSPDERACLAACPPAFIFNKTAAAEVGAYKCPGGGCTVIQCERPFVVSFGCLRLDAAVP